MISYIVEDKLVEIDVPIEQEFTIGPDIILSNVDTDVTFKFDWYKKGFTVNKILTSDEFGFLRSGIEGSIKKIVEEVIKKKLDGFILEEYHKYIETDEQHLQIVSQTRDLFSGDFIFDIDFILPKLEKSLGISLTDYDKENDYVSHIIVRINRPHSTDYNPPHKDIYEHLHGENYIPKFINFWIPICGVTKSSSLPLCPGSHLIPESKIVKTVHGSMINNKNYRVSLIKSWSENNKLIKPDINYGEALIFSPHIIHGLSINNQSDVTRVSLEFRLYEKN